MYLGIDIGTSSVKAVSVDDKDTVVEQASAGLNVSRPQAGWSEQNPADWWSATYYGQRVADDPTGPATGSIKVEKGGWWGAAGNSGAYIGRAAYRHFEDPPLYADHHIGFRIVSPG